jgi:hypothetical protein
MTYAVTNTFGSSLGGAGEVVFHLWKSDTNNFIENYLYTHDARVGELAFPQKASGVRDVVVSASDAYSPGIFVPYNLASRHGSTFINGAVDGVALTANLTPVALPDLSATNLNLAFDYMGCLKIFRMWGKDIGDAGLEEATT